MNSLNFSSSSTVVSGHEIISLKEHNSETWFSIIPSYGCALNAFVHNGKHITLSSANKEELQEVTMNTYAGAQLFPYPNRVNNGVYKYNNSVLNLPKNDTPFPHALHGLIYNKSFVVDCIDLDLGTITCSYTYQNDHDGFPFSAKIINSFQLKDQALTVSTTIKNLGETTLPFGHGWHPYFKTGGTANNWQLKLESDTVYAVDELLIPNGNMESMTLFSELNTIGTTELNHCFKLEETGDKVKAILSNSDKDLQIKLELEGYNFLQTYIPPNRNSIALEPQTCAPDAFNNQIGLMDLKPKESKEFKCKITIKA